MKDTGHSLTDGFLTILPNCESLLTLFKNLLAPLSSNFCAVRCEIRGPAVSAGMKGCGSDYSFFVTWNVDITNLYIKNNLELVTSERTEYKKSNCKRSSI